MASAAAALISKTHVRHLLTKLDACDRVQLAIIAHRTGLTDPSSPSGSQVKAPAGGYPP